MYIKPIKYGQPPETVRGQTVGAVIVEILPQGDLQQHISLTIEEAHDLGKWPEPMLRISTDNQKPVLLALSTVLRATGLIDNPQPTITTIGSNITEPD